jgi:D-3-phosphoglycerate dehydrogenase
MSQIAVLDPVGADAEVERAMANSAGHRVVVFGRAPALDDPRLRDTVAILVTDEPVSAGLLDKMPECRAIATYGVGYDNIDLAAASARGIAVFNVPDYCTDEVADHTMALILALERHIVQGDRLVRRDGWGQSALPPFRRVRGQTLGIVGFGRIGKAVAERAVGFGLKILAYDPVVPPPKSVAANSIEELLGLSDIVSLHVPLLDSTRGLMNASRLALMRPGAVLVNTARGGLVDLPALLEAMDNGGVAAIGLDVFPKEPPDSTDFAARTNAILTPHVAFLSDESIKQVQRSAMAAVLGSLSGEDVGNRVA